MSYYWDEFFPWKRDDEPDGKHLAKPIPFNGDFDKNVAETLDWLIRYRKKFPYHRQEAPYVQPIKDGWFHSESAEGRLYHVCDGAELLRFRGAYANAYQLISENRQDMQASVAAHDKATEMRIAMWGVVGQDGYPEGWLVETDDDLNTRPVENTRIERYLKSGIGYRWFCSKCCQDTPKATKAWIKLNSMTAKQQ